MIKFTTFEPDINQHDFAVILNPNHLEKTAEYTTELKEHIAELKPKTGKTYVLINALTAGEFYGSNSNSDYFPELALKKFYKTFETYGHSYKSHANKDPMKASGKVVFSSYNEKMHRVEIIVELDNVKAKDIIQAMENGEYPKTSMGCFVPGTKVVTEGFIKKNIEDIKVDDVVLTHTGQFKKVTELHRRQYSGQMFKIKSTKMYVPEIHATSEHPWLSLLPENLKVGNKHRQIRDLNVELSLCEWRNSEELSGEEFLIVPRPKVGEKKVDKNFAKLCGWYLAEGHTQKKKNSVIFSVCVTDQIMGEIHEALKDIKHSSICIRSFDRSESLRVIEVHGAKKLKEDLLSLCGKYADKKELSPEIALWDKESLIELLAAYISGDGYCYDGNVAISSCNKKLLEQIQWLSLSLGLETGLYKNEHKEGHGFSNHDTTEWVLRYRKDAAEILAPYCTKAIPVKFTPSNIDGKNGVYKYEKFTAVRLSNVEEYYYEGPVHNFEVEEDNSYVVESFAVHNCKLPYDVCSICGKRSKKVSDYCEHLKHQSKKVLKDGRKVYAINDNDLKFFDISFVLKPADLTSSVMAKIANESEPEQVQLSAELGEQFLKSSGIKEADLFKEIEGNVAEFSEDPNGLLRKTRENIPYDVLKKIANTYDLKSILSTLMGLRIFPTPEEFQYVVLNKAGKPDLAEQAVVHKRILMDLGEDPMIPIDAEFQNLNEDLAMEMQRFVPGCSMTKPLIMRRILLAKTGEELAPLLPSESFPGPSESLDLNPISTVKNPLLPMMGLGALYVGYKELFNGSPAPGLERMFASKPWLIPILIGAVAFGATQLQKKASVTNPYFLERLLSTIPASYVASGYYEDKSRKGEQLNNVEEIVRAHPAATALTSFWGTGKLIKLFQKHAHVKELDTYNEIVYNLTPERFDQVYEETLSL